MAKSVIKADDNYSVTFGACIKKIHSMNRADKIEEKVSRMSFDEQCEIVSSSCILYSNPLDCFTKDEIFQYCVQKVASEAWSKANNLEIGFAVGEGGFNDFDDLPSYFLVGSKRFSSVYGAITFILKRDGYIKSA